MSHLHLIELSDVGKQAFDLLLSLKPNNLQKVLKYAAELRDYGLIVGGPLDGAYLEYPDGDDYFMMDEGAEHTFGDGDTQWLSRYVCDDRGRLFFQGFVEAESSPEKEQSDAAEIVVYVKENASDGSEQ